MIGISINFAQIPVDQGKELLQVIVDKSSKTIPKISFLNCHGDILSDLETEFASTVVFSYSSNSTEEETSSLPNKKFIEIFPNIASLTTGNLKTSDWKSFYGKFENLQEFKVHATKLSKENDARDNEVIKFIRVNRNIKHFHVESGNLKLLKDVSKYIPKLVHLTVMIN